MKKMDIVACEEQTRKFQDEISVLKDLFNKEKNLLKNWKKKIVN